MALLHFLSRGHQRCPTRGRRMHPISKACDGNNRDGNYELLGLNHPISTYIDVNSITESVIIIATLVLFSLTFDIVYSYNIHVIQFGYLKQDHLNIIHVHLQVCQMCIVYMDY